MFLLLSRHNIAVPLGRVPSGAKVTDEMSSPVASPVEPAPEAEEGKAGVSSDSLHPKIAKFVYGPRSDVEQRTEKWYEVRRRLLTCSDVVKVLGGCVHESRLQVLKKKLGLKKAFTGNFATEHGVKYEPVAIKRYEEARGIKVFDYGLQLHPKYPWLGGSPDGLTSDGMIIEVKCPYVSASPPLPPSVRCAVVCGG